MLCRQAFYLDYDPRLLPSLVPLAHSHRSTLLRSSCSPLAAPAPGAQVQAEHLGCGWPEDAAAVLEKLL